MSTRTWVRQAVQPRRGWLVLALLLAIALCLPLAMIEARWLIGASALIGVALLAAWLGYQAGQTSLPNGLVGLFGLTSGVVWNTAIIGHLLPSLRLLAAELTRALHWLWAGLQGRWSNDWPFQLLGADLWTRSSALGERLYAWTQAGLTDTVSRDSLILLLFASIATWWLCYLAGWQTSRGRGTLGALLPLGAALLANVALTHGRGVWYLRGFMAGALALVGLTHYAHQQEEWEREGIDYSLDLRYGVRFAGLGLATAIAAAALLAPYITWRQTVEAFWHLWSRPYAAFTQRLDRLFAGRNPVPKLHSEGPGIAGPDNRHDLGGPANLPDDLVFYVHTSDPPPLPPEVRFHDPSLDIEPPKHYWRTITYDVYTGQGWENSASDRLEMQPGAALAEPDYPHTVLTQTYELQAASDGLVPAVNEPLQTDLAVTLIIRTPGDAVGLTIVTDVYTITSAIPAPTEAQLRAASAAYPPDIASRYLALPELPQRVRALAQEITAQAGNPYDKALAIQEHLHSYDYDLEIPAPPPGVDVADYLLFKTRRGYCDYYATAMVVMLRAVGVPARYASGYATGTYDYSRSAYAITARDGHAWVEVYFPGYGWIEFEPTPYRSTFVRPAGGEEAVATASPPATVQTWHSDPAVMQFAALVLAILSLGSVFWLAVRAVRARKDFTTRRLAIQIYGRLVRAADRARLGPKRGDTPLEFVTHLGRALEEHSEWARGAAQETELIGRAYVEARYAATPLSARVGGQALDAWERLRGKLRWARLWRQKNDA